MHRVSNTLNAPSIENPAWTVPPAPVRTSARARTGLPTIAQNRLLAALPAAIHERLKSALELVTLPPGRVLHDCDKPLGCIYFPISSIISLSCELEDGTSGEIAVVGNEGLVGIAPFMGGQTMQNRALVQNAGTAFRIRADVLVREFEKGGPLQAMMLRYIQALITQIAQTVACNRHHVIEQQLCRKLLFCMDRLPTNNLTITQERIAATLGVRRESVCDSARRLQTAGLIDYRRGKLTVLDRPKLESRACECYAVVKKEYNRLLPDTTSVRTIN